MHLTGLGLRLWRWQLQTTTSRRRQPSSSTSRGPWPRRRWLRTPRGGQRDHDAPRWLLAAIIGQAAPQFAPDSARAASSSALVHADGCDELNKQDASQIGSAFACAASSSALVHSMRGCARTAVRAFMRACFSLCLRSLLVSIGSLNEGLCSHSRVCMHACEHACAYACMRAQMHS